MAIAFDAASSKAYNNATTFTHTTISTSNVLVVVYARADQGGFVGMTYGGVAMALQRQGSDAVTNYYLLTIANPPSGAQTIAGNFSGNNWSAGVASYSGAGSVESTNQSNAASLTLTPITASSWGVMGSADRTSFNPTAVSNCVARAMPGAGASMTLFDTNGPISAPITMVSSANGGGTFSIGLTFAPFTTLPPPVFKTLTGKTKTTAGVAIPSCLVRLYRTSDDALIGEQTSDAGGIFTFSIVSTPDTYYLVGYKTGAPDRFGTTVNTLVGV